MNKKPIAKVYIDGANVFYTQKKLGRSLDLSASEHFFIEDIPEIFRN